MVLPLFALFDYYGSERKSFASKALEPLINVFALSVDLQFIGIKFHECTYGKLISYDDMSYVVHHEIDFLFIILIAILKIFTSQLI